MSIDFLQRRITHAGLIGSDRARGGLYLLLPPDYDGEIPKGYFAFKSRTYNVFLLFRTIMSKALMGPIRAVQRPWRNRGGVYPLRVPEKTVKPM